MAVLRDTRILGNLSLSGNFVTTQLRAADGSVSVPAYTFDSDTDTGIYLDSGTIKFAVGGSEIMSISGSVVTVDDLVVGSIGFPTSGGTDGEGLIWSSGDLVAGKPRPAATISTDPPSGGVDGDIWFQIDGTGGAIGATELNDLSDVDLSGLATNDILQYDGADFVPTDTPYFTSIQLGHASDTTIARSSAGVVTIEGIEVTTNSGTQTLTNKTLTTPTLDLYTHATAAPTPLGRIQFHTGDDKLAVGDGSSTVYFSNDSVLATTYQPLADVLTDLATLGVNSGDNEVLISTAAGVLAWESGATARTSLGLGTGDNVEFSSVTVPATNKVNITAGDGGGGDGPIWQLYGPNIATPTFYINITGTSGAELELSADGVTYTTAVLKVAGQAVLRDDDIGSTVQAHGGVLDDLNTLGAVSSDGEFIVGTGSGVFAYESGATARTSLGLGTADSPQFTAIELGHASDTTIARSGAGVITVEGETVSYTTKADQVISGGATVTALNDGTKSSGTYTPDFGDRPLIYITNGGAFTLAAPSNDSSGAILVTNNGSAGTITFSGFQVGSSTGDALTTTDGHDFMIYITRINSISAYSIQALQ